MLDENDWWKQILGLMPQGPVTPNMAGGPKFAKRAPQAPQVSASPAMRHIPPRRPQPISVEDLPPVDLNGSPGRPNVPLFPPRSMRPEFNETQLPLTGGFFSPNTAGRFSPPRGSLPDGSFLGPDRKSTFIGHFPNEFVQFLRNPQIFNRLFGSGPQ